MSEEIIKKLESVIDQFFNALKLEVNSFDLDSKNSDQIKNEN